MAVLLTILAKMTQVLMILMKNERGKLAFLSDADGVDDNDGEENDVKGVKKKFLTKYLWAKLVQSGQK